MSKIDILGIGVDDIDQRGLEMAIVESVRGKKKMVFAYANVYALNLAWKNRMFREFLNKASVLYCDGEGIRLGARILGSPPPPRTVLSRWVWDLGSLFEKEGFTVFLVGGRAETVAAASERWRLRYPGLRVVGYHHGYFDRNGRENIEIVDAVNRMVPDVLFVGLGMPEQELWTERNLERLHVNAVIPCGGMIDYLSGEAAPTPPWMVGHGLEWLFRLIQNPARMWRRYLLGNPAFVLRVIWERIRKGKRR